MLERIITALVLVAVVLSCMFATQSHYPMFMLMIVAAGVAGYEWFKLMPRKTKYVLKPVAWGFGVLTAALAATALYFRDIALLLWAASILTWLLSIYWVKSYPEYDAWYNPNLSFIGFILISAAVTAIFSVWNSSPWWLMYLFLLVWGADSGAYFVGRKLGKKKTSTRCQSKQVSRRLIWRCVYCHADRDCCRSGVFRPDFGTTYFIPDSFGNHGI